MAFFHAVYSLLLFRCKARMAVLHRELASIMHRRKASLLARHLPPKHEVSECGPVFYYLGI